MSEEFDHSVEHHERLYAARNLAQAEHAEYVKHGGTLDYTKWLATLDLNKWHRDHGFEDLIPPGGF